MKDCGIFKEGMCTGCVGLAEKDWIGKEACPIYQKYKNIRSNFDIAKEIIEGIQEKI